MTESIPWHHKPWFRLVLVAFWAVLTCGSLYCAVQLGLATVDALITTEQVSLAPSRLGSDQVASHRWHIVGAKVDGAPPLAGRQFSGYVTPLAGALVQLRRMGTKPLFIRFGHETGRDSTPVAVLSPDDGSDDVTLLSGATLEMALSENNRFLAGFEGRISIGHVVSDETSAKTPLLTSGSVGLLYEAGDRTIQGQSIPLMQGDALSVEGASGLIIGDAEGPLTVRVRAPRAGAVLLRPFGTPDTLRAPSMFERAQHNNRVSAALTIGGLAWGLIIGFFAFLTDKK